MCGGARRSLLNRMGRAGSCDRRLAEFRDRKDQEKLVGARRPYQSKPRAVHRVRSLTDRAASSAVFVV
jgi:hypothetical protein